MKQFFTFLCALMMILSANAAPQQRNAKALLRQKEAKTQKLQVQKRQKARSFTTFKWGEKVLAKPAFTSTFPGLRNIHRSARRATSNVTIKGYTATFYPATEEVGNSIFYGLHTADWSQSFYFSIFTADGKHDVELGKTYTLDDMEQLSCEWDDEDWNEHYYTAATFTKTRGNGYDVHISATVTDEDGNSFVLSYDEDPVTITGNTLTVDIQKPMTNFNRSSDGTWCLRAADDNYEVQFSYFSADETSRAGSFSGDAIDLYSSYIKVNTGEIDDNTEEPIWKSLRVVDATYQVTETEQRIDAQGTLLASDGNKYIVTMFYVKPHKESETTITADNLEVYDDYFDWFGSVTLIASDNSNSVSLSIYPEGLGERLAGTYVIGQNQTEATVTPVGGEYEWPEPINIFSGQFTIAYDAGSINITGALLGYNNVEYTLNLSYAKPIATRTQALTFTDLEFQVTGFYWSAAGYSADNTQFISLSSWMDEEVAGTYTIKDLRLEDTFVATDITANDAKLFECLDANLSVTYDATAKTAHITGTLLCQNLNDPTDIPEFTVDITATIPAPYAHDNNETDFDEDFGSYELDTDYMEDGIGYVEVRNGDGAVAALKFLVPAGATTLPAGTYTISDSDEPMTVSKSLGTMDNGQITYSFVGYANEQNVLSAIWFLVSGTVTVAENGVITIDAVNTNGKKIMSVISSTDGISSTTTQKSLNMGATKMLEKGRLVIQKNGQRFNALGIEMK